MTRAIAIASLVAACLLASSARAQSTPPPAASTEEASKHYQRGLDLYDEGADAAALAELERAYQLAPNWKVLYELGIVELALHDFAAALHHFEQYLDEGKDAVKRQRRAEVDEHIAKLRQEVATIDVATAPRAEVRLDDVTVATAPLANPLVVNPGHHKLGASKDGLVAESRVISVAGGDRARIELVIPLATPLPQTVALPPPPEPAPAPKITPPVVGPREESVAPRPPPYPLWIGWVTSGALAAGATVTGIAALDANASLTHAKNDAPSTSSRLSTLSSRAHAFAAASDVMTGAAVVTGGVTLYFALRSSRGGPAPASGSASLTIGAGRVAIGTTF